MFMKRVVVLLLVILVIVASVCCRTPLLRPTAATVSTPRRIMLLPLDERFTTRDLFLNMAAIVSSFQVITPPTDIICHLKQPANIPALHQWVDSNIASVDSLVISSEMYLYGGLIASRTSNDTLNVISERLNKLASYKAQYPKLEIYITNVIMRIPAYNSDFEEPWYWGVWGQKMYQWSFFTDRYDVLGHKEDHKKALELEKQIPPEILKQFLWRRDRNHKITVQMLNMQYDNSLFKKIWITLDDNAEYGLNKAEERELRKQITSLNLWGAVNMYPGADEVQLTALSYLAVQTVGSASPPKVVVVYRDPYTQTHIPNYEGQPLNTSVTAQILAAGGIVVPRSQLDSADIIVLVNNWSTEHQGEAPNPQTAADYHSLEQFLDLSDKVYVYADVRFSNGGDLLFAKWIAGQKTPKIGHFTYAGWNTAGNTLGTCISNGILISLFSHDDSSDIFANNAKFQIYRFLEDVNYQAWIRTYLQQYVNNVSHENMNHLDVDSEFYERFVLKGLKSALTDLQKVYPSLSMYQVEDLYFPWHRPFEIGFRVVASSTQRTRIGF